MCFSFSKLKSTRPTTAIFSVMLSISSWWNERNTWKHTARHATHGQSPSLNQKGRIFQGAPRGVG
jgi:hypothetical protein